MKLTKQQQAALYALRGTEWIGVIGLAAEIGTSPEGAAATAGSLVRRGLVERIKRGGKVFYRVTDTGAKAGSGYR